MKDLTADELQKKLGTMCGYVHGDERNVAAGLLAELTSNGGFN